MTMSITCNVRIPLAYALLQRKAELLSKRSNFWYAHVRSQVRCYCNNRQLCALPMYLLTRKNFKGICFDKLSNSSCAFNATLMLPRFYGDINDDINSKYSNKHSNSYELSGAHNARNSKCSSESADDTSWDDVVIDSRIGWHEYKLEEQLESSLEDKLFSENTDNHEENEENVMCNENNNIDRHFDEERELGSIIDNENNSKGENNTKNNKIYWHRSTISSEDVQIEPVKSLSKLSPEYSSEEEEEMRRNKLICLAAQELQTAVEHEIRAEVERDSVDGFAAVPPLTPPYWAVHHIPGTSFFTMTRTLQQKPCKHSRESNESECEELNTINQDDNGDDGDVNSSFSVPKFRSVYDEQVDKQRKHNYHYSKETQNIATEKENNRLRLTWSRDEHRYRALNKTHSHSPLPVLERNVVRSDIHLTIYAPFRVLDLSLLDPDVSICEWSCFDLFVHKTPPSHYDHFTSLHKSEHHYNNIDTVGKNKYKLQDQQRIEDDQECLFVRLAAVNSELRIRGIQFISSSVARSINEYAFFGQSGDPYYHYLQSEYLREEQQRSASLPSQMRNAFRSSSSNNDAAAHVLQTSRVRGSEYDEPFTKHSINIKDTHRHEHIANEVTLMFPHQRSASLHTKTLLTHCVDERGEYARSLLYNGPYITELSSELRDALMTYIMHNLKIDVFLSEYICQMQYFLEQEEYMRWLAKTGHTAELMRRIIVKNMDRSGK